MIYLVIWHDIKHNVLIKANTHPITKFAMRNWNLPETEKKTVIHMHAYIIILVLALVPA